MPRRSENPSRAEVSETVERYDRDMDEAGDEIEKSVEDTEVERQVLDELDFGGSSEGADEVEGAILDSQEVSVGEFEEGSAALEGIQQEADDNREELEERSERVASDAERIRASSSELHSDAATRELDHAERAAEEDGEFFRSGESEAKEGIEKSERRHNEHDQRINAARSK